MNLRTDRQTDRDTDRQRQNLQTSRICGARPNNPTLQCVDCFCLSMTSGKGINTSVTALGVG